MESIQPVVASQRCIVHLNKHHNSSFPDDVIWKVKKSFNVHLTQTSFTEAEVREMMQKFPGVRFVLRYDTYDATARSSIKT